MVTCKHEFKPIRIKWSFFGNYSKCEKCGILRHDIDGDLFYPTNLRGAFNSGKKHGGK